MFYSVEGRKYLSSFYLLHVHVPPAKISTMSARFGFGRFGTKFIRALDAGQVLQARDDVDPRQRFNNGRDLGYGVGDIAGDLARSSPI